MSYWKGHRRPDGFHWWTGSENIRSCGLTSSPLTTTWRSLRPWNKETKCISFLKTTSRRYLLSSKSRCVPWSLTPALYASSRGKWVEWQWWTFTTMYLAMSSSRHRAIATTIVNSLFTSFPLVRVSYGAFTVKNVGASSQHQCRWKKNKKATLAGENWTSRFLKVKVNWIKTKEVSWVLLWCCVIEQN